MGDCQTRKSSPLFGLWGMRAANGPSLSLDCKLCRSEKLQVLFLAGRLWLQWLHDRAPHDESMAYPMSDWLRHFHSDPGFHVEVPRPEMGGCAVFCRRFYRSFRDLPSRLYGEGALSKCFQQQHHD